MRKYEGYESFVLKTLRLQRKKEREPSIANYISTVKLLPVTYSKFLAVDVLSNPNINCIKVITTSIAKKKKKLEMNWKCDTKSKRGSSRRRKKRREASGERGMASRGVCGKENKEGNESQWTRGPLILGLCSQKRVGIHALLSILYGNTCEGTMGERWKTQGGCVLYRWFSI